MKSLMFAVPANGRRTLRHEMTFTDPKDSASFLFKSPLKMASTRIMKKSAQKLIQAEKFQTDMKGT